MNESSQTKIEVPVHAHSAPEPISSDLHFEAPDVAVESTKAPSLDEAFEKAMRGAEKSSDPGAKNAPEKATPAPEAQKKTIPKVAEVPKASANTVPEPSASEAKLSEVSPAKYEAPARFNDTGKADWSKAPESVQAEVTRAIKEIEGGLQKHKEAADRYERVREFDETARRNGLEGVHESLKRVSELEQAFQRNPIDGFTKVAQHFGINLQAVAAHIVGQNPNMQVQEAHTRIHELEAEIQQMRVAAQVPDIVQNFFSENPDADNEDVKAKIAFLLENGTVKDLDGAWKYIQLFTPASNAGARQPLTPAQSDVAHTDAQAQDQPNPAGTKSVSGSPTAGTTTAVRRKGKAPSLDEAFERALARQT